MKVPNPPGSGKDIAKGKGAHREVESEGNRMANLWSDEIVFIQTSEKSEKKLFYRPSGF